MTATVPNALADDYLDLKTTLDHSDCSPAIKKSLYEVLTSCTREEIALIDNEWIDWELTTKINLAIQEFRKLKAEWKPAKKPKFTIWNNTWIFDKIEEWRLIVTKKWTFIICVHKCDILSFDNHFIADDTKQEEIIKEAKLCTETNERAEVTSTTEFEIWKTYQISYKFFLPKDFKKLENRLVIWQIKQKAGDWVTPNPLVCWRIKNENLFITYNNSGDPTWNWENKVVFERHVSEYLWRWVDVKFDIKFDEKVWHINIFLDNEKVFSISSGKVSSSSDIYQIWKEYLNEFFFKFWLYRDTIQKRIQEMNYERNLLQSEWNIATWAEDRIVELNNEIHRLQTALEDEEKWNSMTIYFKDFDVKETNNIQTPSTIV